MNAQRPINYISVGYIIGEMKGDARTKQIFRNRNKSYLLSEQRKIRKGAPKLNILSERMCERENEKIHRK